MNFPGQWRWIRPVSLLWALISLAPLLVHAQNDGGLASKITVVSVPAGRRPVVTFTASDGRGNPLHLANLDAGSVKFTLATLRSTTSGSSEYHNYLLIKVSGKEFYVKGETKKPALAETWQPDFDAGGALKQIRPGVFTYIFKSALPANFDRNAMHVVGGEISRDNGKFVANPIFEFVPSGAKARSQGISVETASCNNCHDPLKAHGGTRREVGVCVLCHTSQLTDPESGESLDFKVLAHKIHRGKLLPSVKAGKPFFVVGAAQQVKDYSKIRYPQMVVSSGAHLELRNCQACHAKPDSDQWKKFPSTAACISCHNNVDLASGQGHKPGAAAEGSCAGCHLPDGPEFGPSVAGAHTYPGYSRQLPGVVFEIVKIDGGRPGESPTVTFAVKNKKGEPIDAAKMPNLRLVLAWPTTDYKVAVEEDVRKAQPLGGGSYSYKFRYVVPADAGGSGAVAIQGFMPVDLEKPNGDVIKAVNDVGFNVVKYFPITDAQATPRRQLVQRENCNGCHMSLATHGEVRRNPEYCVMCHHPAQTDGDKRKTAKGPMPAENIHFKRLIHRLHTGAELGEPFILYGGVPAKPGPQEFGDIRFPGDRRNCVKCHVPGANEPPLPAGVLPTLIPQADGSVKAIQPIASACVGCHTKAAAQAHMDTMTSQNSGEACVTCHGVGRPFAVEKVHRR